MGSKIIQPPFYNSGFYNTGAGVGGPAEWFNKYKWNGNNSFSYNGSNVAFEQALYDNGLGFGAFRIFNQIDLSTKKTIEFNLNLYLQRRTNLSSVTAVIFDTQTVSGVAANKTRLVRIQFDGGSTDTTKIKIAIPRTNNQWSSNIEIPIDVPGDISINLFFDYVNNKFKYKVNETSGEDVITITTPPTNFTPSFFLSNQNFQLNAFSSPYLWFQEKIYLNGTYLKADNEIVFGCE